MATVTNPGSFMATITHPTGNGYCRGRIGYCVTALTDEWMIGQLFKRPLITRCLGPIGECGWVVEQLYAERLSLGIVSILIKREEAIQTIGKES